MSLLIIKVGSSLSATALLQIKATTGLAPSEVKQRLSSGEPLLAVEIFEHGHGEALGRVMRVVEVLQRENTTFSLELLPQNLGGAVDPRVSPQPVTLEFLKNIMRSYEDELRRQQTANDDDEP